LTRKILLGLGNPLGRDDALGLRVAEALRGTEWLSIPAISLENVLGMVEREKPEKLVIVDAAEMGLPPGTIRRLPLSQSVGMLGSTHGLPLPLLLSLSGIKDVILIGVEPKERGSGLGLSPEVEEAISHLISLLKADRIAEIPELARDFSVPERPGE